MYKILKFHWNREESLEGPVFAGEERWESVEEALDDLSLHGWEMQFPLYGPVRANGATGTRLEGFVLVNRATTPLEDLARRISRVESFLAGNGGLWQVCRTRVPSTGRSAPTLIGARNNSIDCANG